MTVQFHRGKSCVLTLPIKVRPKKPVDPKNLNPVEFAGLSIGNDFLTALVDGSQIGSILTLQTGFPLTVFAGGDYARNQATGFIRPDATGISPDLPRRQDPRRFFNEAAFAPQPEGSLGNVGRNTLTGPGLISGDFSSLKDFRIREGHTLQFRFEAFNLPNHPNWGNPNTDIRSGGFNTITSTRTNMRNLQFALKYLFRECGLLWRAGALIRQPGQDPLARSGC